MSSRLIAIGDVHGYAATLAAVLEAIEPLPRDTIVTLGDYCDRGPDTQGVIGQLIELAKRCTLVPILGNHDEMLLDVVAGDYLLLHDWLSFGGTMTLWSYNCTSPDQLPAEHIDFLKNCRPYHESNGHFFVHASYLADVPLRMQPLEILRWEPLSFRHPGRHVSGKQAITGHTSQRSGEILDLGYLKCIDTWLYGGGWLTALDVESGRIWQADQEGRMRGGGESMGESG
jgi:serine/threonine protein phosphatase 1